jgi:hypothetical protein
MTRAVRAAVYDATGHFQRNEPIDPAQRANWLPTPKSDDFSLYMRAYGPSLAIVQGKWTPPPVMRVQ